MNPAQSAGKSAKTLAQQIAKQIAQEPLEILNTARGQVTGQEISRQSENNTIPQPQENPKKGVEEQKKQTDNLRAQRRMEALNRELADMEKQNKFKEIQKRISEGEEVPLEEYPELSLEQKQVLMAQIEAVKTRKLQESKTQNEFVEPTAKKGRQMFNFGKKTAMKREQTHVEKVVPPSG